MLFRLRVQISNAKDRLLWAGLAGIFAYIFSSTTVLVVLGLCIMGVLLARVFSTLEVLDDFVEELMDADEDEIVDEDEDDDFIDPEFEEVNQGTFVPEDKEQL